MTRTELIAAIEAGPVTRELNDRVLEAIGAIVVDYTRDPPIYRFPKGALAETRPAPLEDLQDATLAVPEGDNGRKEWGIDSGGFARVVLWVDGWPHTRTAYVKDSPATALTLAGLRAEQAKREAEG